MPDLSRSRHRQSSNRAKGFFLRRLNRLPDLRRLWRVPVILLQPYKRVANPHLGFCWSDILRPVGCASCGWYGTDPKLHPLEGKFECRECGSRNLQFFPGIEPDMLQ